MSEQRRRSGKLYLCATPIGNLEDITLRALRVLRSVDLIAAEDTRHSVRLLNHFEIKTPLTSYHEHNRIEKAYQLAKKMRQGQDIALIADAGTPVISDPGEDLVRICHERGIEVTSLPGPSACITALTLSGLPARRFSFEAFLPADKKRRAAVIEEMREDTRAIVVYEAPHRLLSTLRELRSFLGERNITLCREMTKRYETVFRTTLSGAISHYESNEVRGEYVVVIEGCDGEELIRKRRESWRSLTVEEHMAYYTDAGADRKSAMKQVAKDRGVGKSDIYRELLRTEKDRHK